MGQRNYDDPELLTINTLENAIYMSMKNDLAFVLDCRLMLYEHQSTPNPNIPLRDLFYVAKEYEKIVATRSLYSREKVKIPAPHFIVFYNGMEKQPEREVLKLSDFVRSKRQDTRLRRSLFLKVLRSLITMRLRAVWLLKA